MENYALEVQRDTPDGFEHVGYMRAHFSCPEDANEYYAIHNPRMRQITAFGSIFSDWDPDTKLRYVIRRNDRCKMTIAPFDSKDDFVYTSAGHSWPDLPRPPRKYYVRKPFQQWAASLRLANPDIHESHYTYWAGEVCDFLNDFDRRVGDVEESHCVSWDSFKKQYIENFNELSPDIQQAAANTYFEWYHGRCGRQLAPQYRTDA